ncbi:hypothetical protein LCGC14_0514490 [marine sediment metagenome]|uniref:Calcineurin-like phosphoesterase domain-containing protein n=1 Tax=marine sediment metagenome TaxID=412755 RepID=A0A0F9S086_9ZZZZ
MADYDVAKFKKMVLRGDKPQDIAKEFGLSARSSVYDRARVLGIPIVGRNKKPEMPSIPAPQQKARVMTKLTTDWGKMETAVIYNDTHNPYHDKVIMALFEQFITDLQPDYLIHNGDANDFYPLSKFDKNPERISNLQGDLDSTSAMFGRHRKLVPNARSIEIDGNHEDRLRRFLWSIAPELANLRCLDLNKLLGLEENEISHVGYEEGLLINGIFLVIHGNIASIHSGYTAKRMYEKHGGCGMCGHCHRGGSFYKRDRFGTWGWWENFCMCDLDPDYTQNPNWTQGFSVVHFKKKRFWVEQVPIINGKFIYGGKLYGGEDDK